MKLARRYGLAMNRARKVGSLLVMIGFVAFTTATSKPRKNNDRPAPLPDTPPAPTSFATPAPVDVDALFLAATLACGGKPANTGCKLLKEFDLAPAWVDLPVEPAVWFGEIRLIDNQLLHAIEHA